MSAAINADSFTYCADISISNYTSDGLIATTIDFLKLMYCAEDTAGRLNDAINAGNLIDCADIMVSDDTEDGLIATAMDAGNSTDCAKDDVGG